MKLSNPFSEQTRNIFLYVYSCMDCSRSDRGLQLHHITGRTSDSPLNAIPLCLDCHSKCGHSFDEESTYLQITMRFLLREHYSLNEEDINFYSVHKQKYSAIIIR